MTLKDLIPMLCVCDVAASLVWYREHLGFDLDTPESKFEEDGQLRWCMIRSGQVRLMLTGGSAWADENDDRRAGRAMPTFYFYPDDVVPLYESLRAGGCEPTEPFVTFYGMKEITLKDPDGYSLWFGSPTDEAGEKCP